MTRTHAIAAIAAAAALSACTHPRTPEGHEGYVYHIPLMFGKTEFRDTMRGPDSTGVSWRLYVTNIDMRTKSYKEDFSLLTRDNLSVEFEVNTRISLRPGAVKEVVERWGGVEWYEWNVREPLRTIVRTSVTEVNAVEIQLKTESVRLMIEERLLKKYEGTPVNIESVDVGNIRFPKKVMEAIERKIGTQQELQRQEFVLAKTRKEAAIRVLNALKEAKQQRIITETLDPLYVQRLAVDVYGTIGASGNNTVVVLPNSDKGTGLPLVLSGGKRKPLTAADEKMLEEMETRYMTIAKSGDKALEEIPTDFGAIDGAAPPEPEPEPAEPAPAEPAPAEPATP
jgi:regulator of protease activity HflC (stomatin/prohibitin superfamily)